MILIRTIALTFGLGLLAGCSSYSPALNPEPAGQHAVYELDPDQARQLVYGVMNSEYAESNVFRGKVTPLPPPAIGYTGQVAPFNSLGWTTTVVITPVMASYQSKSINAVRIEVKGSTAASPVAGTVLYNQFKAHLKSELDNSGSLRLVDSYVVRTVPYPAPIQAQTPPGADKGASVSIGTGFAILNRRTLATAFHVVAGAQSIEVICGSSAPSKGTVAKVDPANDLALLTISEPAPGYLEMSPEDSLSVGQKVFTMGFPVPDVLGYEPKYSEGTVSALSGLQGAISLIQITVPIQPGNSGGPLTDDYGRVVGVITSSAAIQAFLKQTGTLPQNINWAVKSGYLHLLLGGIAEESDHLEGTAVARVQKSVCVIKARS